MSLSIGSPPLTRGKVSTYSGRKDSSRITPAYAGKSERRTISPFMMRDHPRLRGEKQSLRTFKSESEGSPPLTRGKEAQPTGNMSNLRITPAYAGKRGDLMITQAHPEDHPRLRGEKRLVYWGCYSKKGSPPLTRGKACDADWLRAVSGITPAYAGKRRLRQPHRCRKEDHPRLRGEKLFLLVLLARMQGSPPLTRGKASSTGKSSSGGRITPAYAGKRAS